MWVWVWVWVCGAIDISLMPTRYRNKVICVAAGDFRASTTAYPGALGPWRQRFLLRSERRLDCRYHRGVVRLGGLVDRVAGFRFRVGIFSETQKSMFARLFLLFVLIPLADLVLLWMLFVSLPWWTTLAMILLSASLGAFFARRQGLKVLSEIRTELSDNLVPANTLVDGVMVLFAGALLITPGLITDAFGFLLLIPYTRRLFRDQLFRVFKKYLKVKTMNFQTKWDPSFQTRGSNEGDVIDGEIIGPSDRSDVKTIDPKKLT